MNNQDIIDWKLSQLNQHANEAMPENMQEFVVNNPALQQELHFIENFWQPQPDQQPSSKLDANFYQMLANAQRHSFESTTKNEPKTTWQEKLTSLLTFNGMGQYALLTFIFFGGMQIPQFFPKEQTNIAALQQEVASLNTLMALSMLDKNSAAERLTGVSYSQQSDLSDPRLMQTLLTQLASDHSTAVRLAIVQTVANSRYIESYETALTDLAVTEKNVLVQIALCRMLLTSATISTQQRLLNSLAEINLDPDVSDFINQMTTTSSI